MKEVDSSVDTSLDICIRRGMGGSVAVRDAIILGFDQRYDPTVRTGPTCDALVLRECSVGH